MEEKKITKEDYFEALEIVKAYHQQIKDEVEYVRVQTGVRLIDVIYTDCNISGRLRRILREINDDWGRENLLLEDVSENILMWKANVGKVTLKEFSEMKARWSKPEKNTQ